MTLTPSPRHIAYKAWWLLCVAGFMTLYSGCKDLSPLPTNRPLIGSDRDMHGCIGSAGYTWDETQNTCARIWETPLKKD